jgi:hypothetical protein
MGTPNYGGQLPPTPPPPPIPASKGNATTALILGIVSVVCCNLLGPVAWYLGNKELKAIRLGAAPPMGEGSAKAGMILGIIGTVLLGLFLIWMFLGGIAAITTILRETTSSY